MNSSIFHTQGRIQDFKLGGAHSKKLRRAKGGAKIFGVFRVKNHDFTPKKSYFSNFRGGRAKFWGISCDTSRNTFSFMTYLRYVTRVTRRVPLVE
jgi:hypothetical protein